MRSRWGKLALCTAAFGWLATGAGLGAAPASAASAPRAMAALNGHHHLASPFGLGTSRAARHVPGPRTRTQAVPHVTPTEWVSNTVAAGSDTSCASPGFGTISAALSAVTTAGTIIKVCPGTYTEQLAITQSVALQAVGSVTVLGLAAPASDLTGCDTDGGSQPNQDVVDICGPVTVSINGFTIEGNWPALACYDSIYGVAVLGGATLNMSKSTVENIGGDPTQDGCQGGVGVQVGLALTGTTADPGKATLTNDLVDSYQKNGITADGKNSHVTVSGTTVTGAGPTTAIAQNGIQVSDRATASISKSVISGDECDDTSGGCGPNGFTQTQDAGILLFDGGGASVSSTTVQNCDIGVYNIEDFGWAFFTPPAIFTPVSMNFTGMNLTNRYENAFFDQGTSSIATSTLSGGTSEVGIEIAQYAGQTAKPTVTATGDTITGSTQDGILVASDGTAGDKAVTLTATTDTIGTPSPASGVDNQSTSVLTATNDWWGDGTGPSGWSFGAAGNASVSSDVNFFPWATDSGFTGQEACTRGNTEKTTANDIVLCASTGTVNAFLANNGSGNVLLIGNTGNDQFNGSSTGETWMIGGLQGTNTINGKHGTGFIQKRGNHNDTLIGTSGYTVAKS
ncbi:MAG TPA: hypothetical protein VGI74_07320 [Streptosporangiaceae bacterium]